MPSTDRLSNIARARVSAVVLDEASGRERAATEVFNKVDAHPAAPSESELLGSRLGDERGSTRLVLLHA